MNGLPGLFVFLSLSRQPGLCFRTGWLMVLAISVQPMKRILLALFALSTVALAEDESVEPPLQYTLTVGGKSQQISENAPFSIGEVKPDDKAVLSVADQRIFGYRGLTFPYPRYFSFEADLQNASSLSWTLSGNDCTLMVFAFSEKLTPQQFAASLAERFGSETKISTVDLTLGGTKYAGAKVDATITGTHMVMEILPLASPSAKSMLLVIQDSMSDAGTHSPEYAKVMAALGKSFREAK
jgi:hypothetical protein